jgi:protein required for attachment to host cells
MRTTWVVAADSSRARIFELSEPDRGMREVEDLLNPEGRQANRDVQVEPNGRFGKGAQVQAHTAEPAVRPVEHEVELFSKRVGHYLDQACSEHRFDKLLLIAPPKFLGMMRDNIGEQTRKAVEEEIPKNVAWFQDREIEEYLQRHPH